MKRILLLLACVACAGPALADEAGVAHNLWIGGDVHVTEAVDGRLRAMGGNVTVDAPVNGDVQMAGGTVLVAPAAVISGDASIAGGNVTIAGAIKGTLRVAGGHVRIDGPVSGDAAIAAGTLELGPRASIAGKLRFRGEELRRDAAATVAGGIDQATGRSARNHHHAGSATERFLHGWLWSIGLILLAGLLAAALPGASQRMAVELRERPWITPLVGLLALTTIPVAAVLIMITIIGIPVGLLALVAYAALLLLGYVWVAVVVGGMLLDLMKPQAMARTAWHAGAAALAMLALALLARVPVVGGLVQLMALAVGVGMIVAVLAGLTRPATPPTMPAAA